MDKGENDFVTIETTNSKKLFDNLTKLGFNFNNVDFDILECKVHFSDGEVLIEKDEFEPSNPLHTVEQVLKLNFFNSENITAYPIKLTGESKEMVRLYAEFLPFNYEFNDLSYEEIYHRLDYIVKKKKARFGLIVADECNSIDLYRELKPVVENIMFNDGQLSEKLRVLVSQTLAKIEPEPFILDMKADIGKNISSEKNAKPIENETDRILYTVVKDGLVLISKKGKNGKNGRDHYGRILPVPVVIVEDLKPLRLKYDKRCLREEEIEGEYYYFALQDGHIHVEHSKDYSEIIFNNVFQTKMISRHQTGDIKLPSSTIKVSDFNNPKDLIHEVSIVSDKLDVNGSIGENSFVDASDIMVNGTTHLTSSLKGNSINIKIHKGSIEGKIVNIKEVETGSVIKGEIVHIDRALGGTIIGNEVYIKECKNNNTVVARKIIKIGTITGEHNKVSIEDGILEDEKNEMEGLKQELKQINFTLQSESLVLKKMLEIINSQKVQKAALEDKIKEFPDISKVPVGIINNYKLIANKIKEYNNMFTAYQETKDIREKTIARIAQLENEIVNSYISIETNGWNNKYFFKTLAGKTIEYKGHQSEKLYLTINEDLDTVENGKISILTK